MAHLQFRIRRETSANRFDEASSNSPPSIKFPLAFNLTDEILIYHLRQQAGVTLIASRPSLRYHSVGLIERPTVRVKGQARSNRKLHIT